MPRVERHGAIGVEHEAARARLGQVGGLQKGDVRRFDEFSVGAFDHQSGEAQIATRRLVVTLRGAAQVDDGSDAQGLETAEVGLAGPGMMAGAQQPAGLELQPARPGVAAVVTEILDALEGDHTVLHGVEIAGDSVRRETYLPSTSRPIASRYFRKAARPSSVRQTRVRGLRLTKLLSTATKPASSSLRRWTE